MINNYLLIKLRPIFKLVYHITSEIGFKPISTVYFLRGIPIYIYQSIQFYLSSKNSNFALPISVPFPCLTDRYDSAGHIDKHYFHQDLWAARKVYENKPEKHIDVGSRIDGFIAHLLTFRDVEVLDVREMTSPIRGMTFRQADLMQSESVPESICDSVSCLHALEHFGLGRYGDPIDPEGHIKGLKSLTKILKPGGRLLLSVPIGKERVDFNAHRVFLVETIFSLTKADYELISFSYIDDLGKFQENANYTKAPDMIYGCGMFELKKL